MNAFQKEFGKNLRYIRRGKKITQTLIAERISSTPTYISQIEAGKANPTLATIEKIAQALDIELAELFRFLFREPTPNQFRESLKTIIDRLEDEDLLFINEIIVQAVKR